MIIGLPKELMNNGYRVGVVPAGAPDLIRAGHGVVIESSAGEGSGIPDMENMFAGAEAVPDVPPARRPCGCGGAGAWRAGSPADYPGDAEADEAGRGWENLYSFPDKCDSPLLP
jgi:hypothetical protein